MAYVPLLLQLIFREADKIAPNRSRATDGAIRYRPGPPSDHYADGYHVGAPGPVNACDLTHDPGDFDAHWWGEQVRQRCKAGLERRVKYLVSYDFVRHTDIIASPTDNWAWRTKSGDDHASHLHISILDGTENSTAPMLVLASSGPSQPVNPWIEWSLDVPKPEDFVGMFSNRHGAWKVNAKGEVHTVRGMYYGGYTTLKPPPQGTRYCTGITERDDGVDAPGYTLIFNDGSPYKFGPGFNGF